MGSNQAAGVYQQGAQVTESPTHGGKVPAHGGKSPVHGSPNTSPNLGPELVTRPFAGANNGLWTITPYEIKRNGEAVAGVFPTCVAGVAAHNYFINLDVAGLSGDTFTVSYAGVNVGQISANGHYEFPLVNGAGGGLSFVPWSGGAGQVTVTNLSIRENFG